VNDYAPDDDAGLEEPIQDEDIILDAEAAQQAIIDEVAENVQLQLSDTQQKAASRALSKVCTPRTIHPPTTVC
jgi:hypothetical protein